MGLYFVRHGQTDWNVERKLQGKSDIPLNATGRQQAVVTREALKGISMDAIYCSPLQRAKETAAIINELWKLDIQYDERLCERGFGVKEGVSRDAVDFDSMWAYSSAPMFEGAEDTASFYARVEEFLDEIIPQALDQDILLVAHGGVSVPFQCYFDGYAVVENLGDLIIDNCAVKHYDRNALYQVLK